jgi:hypothetical protein
VDTLPLVFTAIGAVALMVGVVAAFLRVTMLVTWRRCRAEVKSYVHQRASRGSAFRKITLRFQTEDGTTIEATDDGIWNGYTAGDTISILHVASSDPPRVVVPELLRFWLVTIIFVPFGAAFLFVALVYLPGLR